MVRYGLSLVHAQLSRWQKKGSMHHIGQFQHAVGCKAVFCGRPFFQLAISIRCDAAICLDRGSWLGSVKVRPRKPGMKDGAAWTDRTRRNYRLNSVHGKPLLWTFSRGVWVCVQRVGVG